jgi:hypothetical protein
MNSKRYEDLQEEDCKLFHKTSAVTGLKLGMLGRSGKRKRRGKRYTIKTTEEGIEIVREVEE